MKLCTQCGQELEDDVLVCHFCGQEQKAPSDEEDPAETHEADEEAFKDVSSEEDEFEEFKSENRRARLQIDLMAAAVKVYRLLTGKEDEPHLWQIGIACASALGAVFFLISAFLGTVFSLPGVPACLIFGYFALKKPKFNSVAMLIPILLFALMLSSMSASFHGFMDASLRSPEAAAAITENYFDRFGSVDSISKMARSEQAEAVLDTLEVPIHTGAVLFRLFVYTIAAIYLFAQLGKLRSVVISTYSMVTLSAACAVYHFIRMFFSIGGGMVLFNLAASLFMAAWTVFVFFSEKMSQNRKSRVLHRFFRITPASDAPMNKTVSVCRIIALALAGLLVLLSLYVLVLSIVGIVDTAGDTTADNYIFRYILITLFQLAALLGDGFMYWRLGVKLEKCDDSFLKHYLILGFYSVGLLFMLCSTPMISGWGLFCLTLAGLVVFAAGTLYLSRCDQIYDYFGSDSYITQCTLLKKLHFA